MEGHSRLDQTKVKSLQEHSRISSKNITSSIYSVDHIHLGQMVGLKGWLRQLKIASEESYMNTKEKSGSYLSPTFKTPSTAVWPRLLASPLLKSSWGSQVGLWWKSLLLFWEGNFKKLIPKQSDFGKWVAAKMKKL